MISPKTKRFLFLLLWLSGIFFALKAPAQEPEQEPSYRNGFYNPRIHSELKDNSLHEISGIIYWNGSFWGHGDSGSPPEIYRMDTATGKILQTLRINNARHIDWEDITQDKNNLYIGDFGNNLGNRKDLKIYILSKTKIPATGDANMEAGVITFRWEMQKQFEAANRKHNFDCEAMTLYQGRLLLFTKNWGNLKTDIYSLPAEPGDYTALHHTTFDAGGLVTGAEFDPKKNILFLCGYKHYIPILWLIKDFQTVDTRGWKTLRLNLDDRFGAQTEGICMGPGNKVYISTEETSLNPALLFRAEMSELIEKLPLTGEDIFRHTHSFVDGKYRILTTHTLGKAYDLKIMNRKGKTLARFRKKSSSGTQLTIWQPEEAGKEYIMKLSSGKYSITTQLLNENPL